MSTRCNVVVVDVRTGDRTYLYHHCDGYPQGVGRELTSMLSRFRLSVTGREQSLAILLDKGRGLSPAGKGKEC